MSGLTRICFIFGLLVKTCLLVLLCITRLKIISNQKKETSIVLCMIGWITLHTTRGSKLNTNSILGKRKGWEGPYPVDGFDQENNSILQFHGCYWHGHNCWLTKSVKDEKWHKNRQQKYDKTLETTLYLQSLGYNVVEMWECEFRKQMHSDTILKTFIDSSLPKTPQQAVNEREILAGVQSGGLFGMVEVDINVPDQWPDHFSHPTMTPYEYFQEMSPMFCTTDVPYDMIGSHMHTHVRKFGLPQKPTGY